MEPELRLVLDMLWCRGISVVGSRSKEDFETPNVGSIKRKVFRDNRGDKKSTTPCGWQIRSLVHGRWILAEARALLWWYVSSRSFVQR